MSSRRHWVEDEYEYTRPARYSNTSSNVYVTPQRYVGKTYVRTIPNVAHQRLTTTSYPPRSYTPHHYDEERILGYRVPPSSHAITTTSYRPWIEEEPMVDYMPYQPTRHIDYRPSYADTWKSTISPSTRARWHTDEDEDYMLSHDRRVVKRSNDVMTPYRSAVVTGPHHYSYADKYQADLEDSLESSGAIVPGNYFAARHTEPTTSIMLRRPIPKPRGPYEDLADEYPAHGRKYVVVPMRNVYNNIYNMSYYRKPMQQANIGRGHLACIRFIGSKAIHPLRAEKEKYDITKIPREVASLSLYGNMIAAVRDHKLVRVSIHPIQWRDDEGAPKKSRILDVSVETTPRKWRFMGGDGGLGTLTPSDKITEITETKPKAETKVQPKVERKPEPKPVHREEPKPAPKKEPTPEPAPKPKKEPTPEPIKEPTPEPIPEPPKEEPKPEQKKKKRSKGSAAEPEKVSEPPKEEPKPEPPKEEPKAEPPKEEPKPEPPKEEPKPEPPKEEPKPEPPKEEPKPEPPKEEPEPPKEEPEPPKEEPKPEPPKEEPEPAKEEPEPPKEEPAPEPPKEEVQSEPSVLETEPPKEEPPKEEPQPEPVKEEPQPEAAQPEPVKEEPPKEEAAPEPVTESAPAPEEAPQEAAVPTEPAPEVPVSEAEAPKEDSAPEQPKEAVPETPAAPAVEPELAAEAEDTLSDEAALAAAQAARQAARRVSAFEEDPAWLQGLSEGGGGGAQN